MSNWTVCYLIQLREIPEWYFVAYLDYGFCFILLKLKWRICFFSRILLILHLDRRAQVFIDDIVLCPSAAGELLHISSPSAPSFSWSVKRAFFVQKKLEIQLTVTMYIAR